MQLTSSPSKTTKISTMCSSLSCLTGHSDSFGRLTARLSTCHLRSSLSGPDRKHTVYVAAGTSMHFIDEADAVLLSITLNRSARLFSPRLHPRSSAFFACPSKSPICAERGRRTKTLLTTELEITLRRPALAKRRCCGTFCALSS